MNMQFGFGGYDPYMMMGYGNFNPSGGMGGSGGMAGFPPSGGGFPPFGGGFPPFGGGFPPSGGGFPPFGGGFPLFGGGFPPFGGGFPNYYPMFNPMALYSMGQQFYNNQFMPPRDSQLLSPKEFGQKEQSPTKVVEEPVGAVESTEEPMVNPTEPEVTQVGDAATSAANGQQVSTNSPVVNTHYDEAVKNPVQYQTAGKFGSAEERTRAGNQLFKAGQDIGGKVGKRVARLASTGRVKKAQAVLGKKHQRDVRKRG